MITIHAERCNGCGACLEVCPHGALYLIEGKAVVDEKLCHECEACVAACPTEAIVIVEQVATSIPTQASPARPAPHIIPVEPQPAPVPLQTKVLPVVGAALSWAGRELVPRLAYYLFDGLDRQATRRAGRSVTRGGGLSDNHRGTGRQQRRRYRGGRGSTGQSSGLVTVSGIRLRSCLTQALRVDDGDITLVMYAVVVIDLSGGRR